MENNYFEEEQYLRAQKRLKQIKGFYWHLFWYLVVNIFLLVVIYSNTDIENGPLEFEYFSTPVFWGIGLLAHGIGVFGRNIFFSKGWEERKIKEYMEKDKLEQ